MDCRALFCFFKQKTAYEMRISDWSADVCSSDLVARLNARTEEVTIAEAGYRPQLSGGIGSGFDNIIGSRWQPRANLSATQMLFDFGKVKSSVDAAEAGSRIGRRSEERRVGKECVSTCRSRGSPKH